MDTKSIPAVELDHITKRFAKVLANDDVSITVNKGEVVALLGENGAGKSTIMKILYGLYHATSGEIRIDGRKERIDSPKDAVKKGISMIQQHFSLVPAHTVTENIILGNCRGVIDYKAKEKEIQFLKRNIKRNQRTNFFNFTINHHSFKTKCLCTHVYSICLRWSCSKR